jgi:hypothetical protein
MNIFMDDVRSGPTEKSWVVVRGVENVKILLEAGLVDDMSLDHDMGYKQQTGYDLVKWMAENDCWPKGDIVIHSANIVGAENMKCMIDNYYYDKNRP